MSDIANSRTPEEREQKISEHQAELDNYKASGINVANDIQYLRDKQGMETVSLFNKVASLISSYSYGGVEAQSILSPSNTAFDNVEYAADGTVTETNPDGVSNEEAIQQSEDRNKVFNGIRQEFSDFFSNPIRENLPLILAGTVVSTGIELQNSANSLGLSKKLSKAIISNPLPAERIYARVMPEKFAKLLQEGKVKLSPNADSWVTAAEDLKGITSTEEMAKKLTLIDKEGALRLNSNAVVEFRLKNSSGDCVSHQ